VHRVLDTQDIAKVANTYHAWRTKGGRYIDVPGFCKRATLAELRDHEFELTPGRYVGAAEPEDDGEPFADKLTRLTSALARHTARGHELDTQIQAALAAVDLDD
jgi:type I restriction enzyme M protein